MKSLQNRILHYLLLVAAGCFAMLTATGQSHTKQLSDVATVYIDVFDGSGIYSKTEWKLAKITEILGDSVAVYDSVQVRGRGNSTWGLEKKPYRVKFKDKVKWLGKGHAKAKNWVLMANHADKTLLRNAVANYIGTELGQPFTPGSRFVDLVLNNQYVGTYQITDHIDIRPHRIDITEQEEKATAESDITGGYLIECDGFYDGACKFRTNRGVPCNIKSPDSEIINSAQKSYIQNVFQTFEDALYSSFYKDAEKGYRALVDTATLISWYLATEFTGNPDGYWSANLYKDAGDPLLYWGPMWDYDIAFNNCNRTGEVTEKLMTDYGFGGGVIRPWMERMVTDDWFNHAAAFEWKKAIAADIVDRTLAYVDSMAEVIEQTQALNFDLYSISSHVYNEITLYSTYQEGVDYMKKFIREHADYLSKYFAKFDGAVTPDPDPEPDEAEYGTFSALRSYHIRNVGNQHLLDVIGDEATDVCTWSEELDRSATQTWQLHPGSSINYFMILTPDGKMAVTDCADVSYSPGTPLSLSETSLANARQQWRFVKTSGNWVIENLATHLAWNNSGGGASDGNRIISWTNDQNNAFKTTRQWTVEEAEDVPNSLRDCFAEVDYRVLYCPENHQLRIAAPEVDLTELSGAITVSTPSGRHVAEGVITAPLDLSSLLPGVYIVAWSLGGHSKSIKFTLR